MNFLRELRVVIEDAQESSRIAFRKCPKYSLGSRTHDARFSCVPLLRDSRKGCNTITGEQYVNNRCQPSWNPRDGQKNLNFSLRRGSAAVGVGSGMKSGTCNVLGIRPIPWQRKQSSMENDKKRSFPPDPNRIGECRVSVDS